MLVSVFVCQTQYVTITTHLNVDYMLALADDRPAKVKKLLAKSCEWVELNVDKGPQSVDERFDAGYLSTDILVAFLKAGFAHKQLSNYFCLLPLILDLQPPSDPIILTSGQFVNWPLDSDPLDDPHPLKDYSDMLGEQQHRANNMHRTNNGGGRTAKHKDTVASDTAQRDYMGQGQRLERHQVQMLEELQCRCPVPSVPTQMFFKNQQVQFLGETKSVEYVLEHYVHHTNLRYITNQEAEECPDELQEHLRQIGCCGRDTGLTDVQIEAWLKRQRYPRRAVPTGPRLLKPKLSEAPNIVLPSEQVTRPRRQPSLRRGDPTAALNGFVSGALHLEAVEAGSVGGLHPIPEVDADVAHNLEHGLRSQLPQRHVMRETGEPALVAQSPRVSRTRRAPGQRPPVVPTACPAASRGRKRGAPLTALGGDVLPPLAGGVGTYQSNTSKRAKGAVVDGLAVDIGTLDVE